MRNKKFRITVLTPWPPLKDGLSYYSQSLYNAMSRETRVLIIASKLSPSTIRDSFEIVGSWSPGARGLFQAIRDCIRKRGDIFHIQAPPMFLKSTFGMVLLPVAIAALKATRKPVIVTLHTVVDISQRRNNEYYSADNTLQRIFISSGVLSRIFLRLYAKSVSFLSTRIIVHSELMRETLVSQYSISKGKIVVIPHGVNEKKKEIGSHLSESDILELLFFGFIRPSKGLEFLIEAFLDVADRNQDVRLVIAGGAVHPRDKEYLDFLKRKISLSSHSERIVLRIGLLPEEEVISLIERAYAIVLPYLDNFIEVSGVVANVMDYGKPIICTRTPRFLGDLSPNIDCLMVEPGDVRGLSNAIQTILERKDLVETMKRNLEAKARTRYWERIAEEHLKVYAMK
jgi:glycosyltransferase involved in cell wall biosynthesis